MHCIACELLDWQAKEKEKKEKKVYTNIGLTFRPFAFKLLSFAFYFFSTGITALVLVYVLFLKDNISYKRSRILYCRLGS